VQSHQNTTHPTSENQTCFGRRGIIAVEETLPEPSLFSQLTVPGCGWTGDGCKHAVLPFCEKLPQLRNVLILREGNGRFLINCRRCLTSARITCLDANVQMLQLAQTRLAGQHLDLHQIEFIHTDALKMETTRNSFDLIVTHFFLDCFRADQLERLIPTIAQAATANA